MPYIQNKNKIFNVSDKEAFFLELLKEKINKSYAPANLDYTIEDLIEYYVDNEENFIKAIHNKLDYLEPTACQDKLREFEQLAGYPVTKYLSTKTNGNYAMYNDNNTIFNILFAYNFMEPFTFKKIAKDNLKDTSILMPIKNVIKDKRILSLIYPNGFDKVTVYDFLKKYSFSLNSENDLKSIEGIGPVSFAKIEQSLSNFGYPLMHYQAYALIRLQPNVLDKILLSTSEELENIGINPDVIEELKRTKYINNRKTIEKTTNSSVQITKTDFIGKMAKQVAENIAERKVEQEITPTQKEQEKQPKKDIFSNVKTNKYLDLISKMPNSIIKKMIVNEFKSNLNLLLNLGKQEPQLLLDYAECIPFKKYRSLDNLSQVLTVITIQPKLIRKLEPRMVVLLMTSQPAPMHKIIYSDKLTKAEAVSLNAYVNKIVSERLTKKGVTKNR